MGGSSEALDHYTALHTDERSLVSTSFKNHINNSLTIFCLVEALMSLSSLSDHSMQRLIITCLTCCSMVLVINNREQCLWYCML